MPALRTVLGGDPDLSRRDFLVTRLPRRLAGLLAGGATAQAAVGAEAARSEPGPLSPRDLTRMDRDEVRTALARIRARRRGAR
jgi:hypothetical protein